MSTRLAELHTEALDLADPEAFANEAVHIHVLVVEPATLVLDEP